MHALADPPVSEPRQPDRRRLRALAPHLDQRRVVIRLRDGETILVGGAPPYEDALVLAQKTIPDAQRRARTTSGRCSGDRFINPDAIVSVDVLRWSQSPG